MYRQSSGSKSSILATVKWDLISVDTIMFDEEDNLRNTRKEADRTVCPFKCEMINE